MPQPKRSNILRAPAPGTSSGQVKASVAKPGGKSAGPSPAQVLAKVPRRPMSPEQQLAALEKVQRQADQRVKLGQQLFKAAEARLSGQGDVLAQVRAEQEKLREQVQADVAQSLHSYDQWMGRIDEGFTRAIEALGHRLDRAERELSASRGEMERMLAKAEALLDQTQRLLGETPGSDAVPVTVSPSPTSAAASAGEPAVDEPGITDASAPSVPPSVAYSIELPAIDAQAEDDLLARLLDQLRDQAGGAAA